MLPAVVLGEGHVHQAHLHRCFLSYTFFLSPSPIQLQVCCQFYQWRKEFQYNNKLTRFSLLLTQPGFIKSYFDSLYDEEIITEESFYAWQTSPDEESGKGVTVIAASEFFRWLKSAPEENPEES